MSFRRPYRFLVASATLLIACGGAENASESLASSQDALRDCADDFATDSYNCSMNYIEGYNMCATLDLSNGLLTCIDDNHGAFVECFASAFGFYAACKRSEGHYTVPQNCFEACLDQSILEGAPAEDCYLGCAEEATSTSPMTALPQNISEVHE